MRCPKCGTENGNGAKFCGKCGLNLAQQSGGQMGGYYMPPTSNNDKNGIFKMLIIASVIIVAIIAVVICVIFGISSSQEASIQQTAVAVTQTPVPTATPIPAATPLPTVPQQNPAPPPQQLPSGSSKTTVIGSMWVCNVKNSIYLRTNPSDNAGIITTIPLDAEVGYIDTVGSWCKISYGGSIGYSKSQYLTSSAPRNRIDVYGTITGVAHSVYLRQNATADESPSNIICEIPVGASVFVYRNYGNYVEVSYDGYVGYITSKYVTY